MGTINLECWLSSQPTTVHCTELQQEGKNGKKAKGKYSSALGLCYRMVRSGPLTAAVSVTVAGFYQDESG